MHVRAISSLLPFFLFDFELVGDVRIGRVLRLFFRPLSVPPFGIMKDVDDPDTFNIFIATDNHLGFKETDAVRGDDSFNAMEEIFQMAGDYDMLVLGGDLFHDNKPTRHCLHRTIGMFRKHCLKDKAIKFNVVSDPVRR